MMIKALLFDWHGVLDKTKFSQIATRLCLLTGLTKKEVSVRLGAQKTKYILGNMKPSEFWNTVKAEFGLTQTALEPLIAYNRKIIRNIPLWNMLPKLKDKYKLGILSDCPPDKTQCIKSKVNLSLFDFTSFSSDEHVSKTVHNESFFENAITALHLPREQILYIDDTKKHLITAKNLGMRSYLYVNSKMLFERLHAK